MRYHEIVSEVFDQGKNWSWEFRGSEEAFATFTVGEIEYLWTASVMNKRDPTQWTLTFRQRGQQDMDKMFGLTGTGNSQEVISTVVDITREFLKQYGDKVLEIKFSSEGDSRTSLYAKMVKRLLPNWDMSKRKAGSEFDFLLINPRAYDLYQAEKELAEAFNKPYDAEWEEGDYGTDALVRLPDGTPLSIMFNLEYNGEGEEFVQVEFHRNNSQEVTGEGDAQRIFATVLDAIQKYIKKYKPERLIFSASKAVDMDADDSDAKFNPESRAKLYDRLVQRYASAWGYRASRDDNGDIVIYELNRLGRGLAESQMVEFEGVNIRVSKESHRLKVEALDDWGNKVLGYVEFNIGDGKELDPQDLRVDDKYQGQGIARTMYDFVKKLGYEIHRSWDQTDAGKGFWDKHRGEEVRVWENFHDGRNPQDKGDSKRYGVPTKASISTLRKVAKQGGRKGQLAHWMANMKSGRAKAKK